MVGWMLLVIHGIFLCMWFPADPEHRSRLLQLALTYLGAGVGVILLRWIVSYLFEYRVSRDRRIRRARQSKILQPHSLEPLDSFSGKPDQGAILVMVLLIVALVSGLVLQAQVAAKVRHDVAGARVREVQLRLAATDALRDAMHVLANDAELEVDHLDEEWAAPIHTEDPVGISTSVHIIDENRYFDINNFAIPKHSTVRSPTEILRDILSLCGVLSSTRNVEALVGGLEDWIDADHEGFYETSFYQDLDHPYRPPNRIVYTWGECTWTEGFERTLFDLTSHVRTNAPSACSLGEILTILPIRRVTPMPINLNTASENTILGVMGIDNRGLMQRIVNQRKARPLRRADATALAVDPNLVQRLAPYVSVRSSFFRVHAVAYQLGHSESVEALVKRDNQGNVHVLQWVL